MGQPQHRARTSRVRRATALCAALCTAAAVAAGASASTLTITTPLVANFPAVTLDGSTHTMSAALDAFSVQDTRGTGEGWHVTVQATRFAEHDGTSYVSGGKTLPAGSLRMPAPTVTADGTLSAPPVIEPGAPWQIDVAAPIKIASAIPATGMGKYDFSSVALSLTVPPSAHAKAYRSQITVSVASGP